MSDVRRIAVYLERFVRPGTVTELRALGGRSILHGFFDSSHIDLMAQCAVDLQSSSKGVYFVPQPVGKPATNVVVPAKSGSGTADTDVTHRHWLLVDIDPVRPADCSSTHDESNHAWQVAMVVYQLLHDAGICRPVVGFSGNGWHLNYPIDLPNDEDSRVVIQTLLHGLNVRAGNEKAKVDTKTFNAARIWKLYGTISRKGEPTEERPHRQSFLVTRKLDGIETAPNDTMELEELAISNTNAIPELLSLWKAQDEARSRIERENSSSDVIRRAKAYLSKVPPAVSGKDGHGATFHVAMILVEGFDLSMEDALEAFREWNSRCVPPWSENELVHKLKSATSKATNRGHLLNQDKQQHSSQSTHEDAESSGSNPEVPQEEDATAADIKAANMSTKWAWEGWIQLGATTCLAAEPGTGKTRYGMDLAKRIFHGTTWPDGTPIPDEIKGKTTLWIPADGQYAEISDIPDQFGIPHDVVKLNAFKSNPFDGTNLEKPEQFKALEERINRLKPVLVFVDTIGMVTETGTTKTEDAKKVFKPFMEIAARTGTGVILVTHLNKNGEALGRRIIGATRQVIKLSKPETCGENDRRLWVDKSSSKKPPALRMIMGDNGNEYDDQAPEDTGGSTSQGGGEMPLVRCMAWVRDLLQECDREQSKLYSDGKSLHGFTPSVITMAISKLPIDRFKDEKDRVILSMRE